MYWQSLDELHGLEIGRNVIKNLYMAGKGINSPPSDISDYKGPLHEVEELRSIAPTDQKQPLDIRSVIARIVDGSEFDEFKKLYGTVSFMDLVLTLILLFSFRRLWIQAP